MPIAAAQQAPRSGAMGTATLGDVIEFRNEIVHPTTNPRGTATFVGLEHIERDTGIRLGSETIKLEEMTGRRARFHAGDIVYGYLRPYLNKVWIAEFDGFCSVDQYVLKVRSSADRRYIAHYLKSATFLDTAPINLAPGQLPRIRTGEITGTPIPLPSLAEQRRISAILDQGDCLRRKRRETLDISDRLVKAFFVKLFGDPIQNSFTWTTYKLGVVGKLERGVSKHRPRNDPILLGGPYPLIQTGDIANADGYINAYQHTYSDAGLRQSHLWPQGTLCITIAANIGKTAILTFDACFPDSIVGFSPSNVVTTEYIQHWFGFVQTELEDRAPQSAQKTINLAILRDLDVPVPPMELQKRFQNFVNQAILERAALVAQLNQINSLFASLQYRAFRGEL